MTDKKYYPARRCAACRRSAPKSEMIRVVLTPEGPEADSKCIKPGRGCYVCRDIECINTAIDKNCFSRSFRKGIARSDLDELREKLIELISSN